MKPARNEREDGYCPPAAQPDPFDGNPQRKRAIKPRASVKNGRAK